MHRVWHRSSPVLLADDYPSLKMRYNVMDRALLESSRAPPSPSERGPPVGGRGVAALDGQRWPFKTHRSNNNNHSWGRVDVAPSTEGELAPRAAGAKPSQRSYPR